MVNAMHADGSRGMHHRDPARWASSMGVAGGLSLVAGSIDPLEGSVLILLGSALLSLGSRLGHEDRRTVTYRTWSFVLVALGVGALFGLSAVGGVGGSSRLSMWWALLILPYPVGWALDLFGPGSPRWITMAGVVIGTWYLTIPSVLLWRVARGAPSPSIVPAIAIAALGAATIVACAVRLRKQGRPLS